jgi:peptidoglycan/xylan/chitin deacetylase (PgdA/CDA1 family)
MNRSSATILVVSLSALVLFLYGAISGCSTARRAKETQRKRDTPPVGVSTAIPSSRSTPTPAHPVGKSGASSKTHLANDQQPPQAAAPDADASKEEEEKEEPKNVIEIVLSFDDGPHAASPESGRNYTQTVFAALKDNVLQKDIKAVFFVQTHAPGRGATPIGQDMISMLAEGGHVIGIHTGSKADHASHRARATAAAYDVNRNRVLDAADGANGLESDMIRAKARLKKLTGRECLYVRPTYGERNRTVIGAYRRQGLKMILWDIDSADNTGSPSVDGVNFNLYEGMRRCVNADLKQIVILFHDINSRTALNLEEYLGNICISARKLGKTAVFPTTTERVMEILNAKDYQ